MRVVARRGRIKPKRVGRILGGDALRAKDVRRLAIALDRWWPALASELEAAERACEEWDRRDAEMAKERASGG